MKRTTTAVALAAFIYVLSWFTPVVDDGATLAKGSVPGWEAFRVALSPIWPYEGLTGDDWFSGLLSVISGLTNIWFVMTLAVLALWPSRCNPGIFWGLVLSALVNTLWFVLSGERGDLRIGYYLWLGSFVVLAVAARLISVEVARPGSLAAAASPSQAER